MMFLFIPTTLLLVIRVLTSGSVVVNAFCSPYQKQVFFSRTLIRTHPSISRSSCVLDMAPKFDKSLQKWIPSDMEKEGPSAGYGIIGSLYRAGPVPFFQRIVNAENYEQAVLKFMAQEGCDRIEAQGNMDAYLENPQDWSYQKMSEKNKGVPKKDYANANMDPQQVILSTIWAGVVIYFGYDLITGIAEGKYGRGSGDLFNGNLWNCKLSGCGWKNYQ